MKSEYRVGEIAHTDRRKRVMGVAYAGTPQEEVKRFWIESLQPVRVVGIIKSGYINKTGGFVYDVEAELGGITYRIDSQYSQIELCSKRAWSENARLRKLIAENRRDRNA